MTTDERARNLARGRATARKNRESAKKKLAREHRTAKRIYKSACAAYYRVRQIHDEGSDAERKAWRKMRDAEVEWFRTYPKGERP
jgi:hypothetical protein